jgi:ferrous iron transport protein B
MKIVLVGNPNVGKSVLFSRLTGAKVIASNYPGTTVSVMKGKFSYLQKDSQIIDSPGIYSLDPLSRAEKVSVELIKEADIIVNVLDATNLERNLFLTCQLIEKFKKPFVVVLNMWDETKHRGVKINVNKLQQMLKAKVVTSCALTGEGVTGIVDAIKYAYPAKSKGNLDEANIWCFIGNIVNSVQTLYHRHHNWRDLLEDLTIKPPWAYFIGLLVIFLSFQFIRFIAEGLINNVLNSLFNNYYTLVVDKISYFLGREGFLHSVLIGNVSASVNYETAFGILTTGLYVPLAVVLPYVFSFYLVLGVMEDTGYLPRLAILSDRLFHKLGLHGFAMIPTILGLGCNVPGALAIRIFEERRERFIGATLLAIGVPCMAQSSIIIAILGRFGGQYVFIVFFTLFLVWYCLGRIFNFFLKGESPEIFLEIPPYRKVHLRSLFKKLSMRMKGFFCEAIPYVLLGVLFVNILYYFKIVDFIAQLFRPLLTGLWGLPQESIAAFIVGFLRKDVAVGMLRPLNLTIRELVVGCTVLAIYFPCMATFMVLLRELGLKDMLKSLTIMLVVALGVGSMLNFILSFFLV